MHVTSFASEAPSAHRLKTAFVHIAFAVAAIACLLATRPGFASDVQAPAMIATADLAHRASVGPSSPPTDGLARSRVEEMHRQDVSGAHESTSSAGSIVEPATIAVLGFTAAALIALRRRKTSAKTAVAAAVVS